MPKLAKRIQRDIQSFKESPPEFVSTISVNEANMREVYFLCQGPTDTDFAGGEYVVKMSLPAEYPLYPPDLLMMTPSGRFQVGKPICTTFTSYHPESWSPSYNFTTIMRSFMSFMVDDGATHVGGLNDSKEKRRKFAKESKNYNASHNLTKLFES
jgi:ubiquitin-protein ligase